MNLEVQVVHVPVVNFAMQQNHVPVLREICLKNTGENDLKGVCVHVSFEPDFAESCRMHIESIPSGSEERLSAIPVRLSTAFLSQLTERLLGHIHIAITSDEESLFSETYELSLLAFDQWGGIAVLPEMLAAFVTPNHPAIAPIIKRASEILGTWTESPALDEYQTRDPNRVKKQMAAVYEAIAEQQIAYCSVPASFEESGQRVRLYDDILSYKLANCLDLSLLYAGCLEAVGIHPLIVVVRGHAFAGGWLIPDTFPDTVNDDVSLLTKRAAEGINEVLLVEATCMNAGMPQPFDAAVASANDKLKETDDFLLFVDVMRARNAQIRPLPQRVIRDGKIEIEDTAPAERDLAAPSALSATDIIPNIDQVHVGKQTIWERKLLDLSLRNNLLNTRITRNTLQLISVRIGELEDALADGQEFQILERPQDWDNPLMSAGIYQTLHASDPVIDLVKNELKQRRLRAYLTDEALRRSLTYLYRSSRLSLEENGANTLYLALGLLKWLETPNSARPRFAPILLLPIEIVRKSAAKGYVIRSRDEETMLNITLLEMLRQYFGIQIGGLDPLPRDESGVDVSRIFNTIRRAIMTRKGWDVEEQAIIGNFSFSKFIMWNDIHNNADKLSRNKIVASLMSGKVEWNVDAADAEDTDLDEAYPAGEIALPIGADSSQFEAICAAVDDRSFILHGPPGTGKSQTITNIIANALYKGRKVLFVAEKMAALQVVQRRLEAIGIAPFCLELHSNKTKKSSVLEQLKRTTEVVKRKSNEEYRIEAGQINSLRRELNDYVHVLHRQRPAGLSLYDCFSGYASTDYGEALIPLPEKFIRELDPAGRVACDRVVGAYRTACRICGSPQSHPLTGIGLAVCPPSVKSEARERLSDLNRQLEEDSGLRQTIASLIGFELDHLASDQDKALTALVRLLLEADTLSSGLLTADNLTDTCKLAGQAIQSGEERNRLREQILARFNPQILTADAAAWSRQWQECGSKWWLPRILGQRSVLKQIRIYAKAGSKPDAARIPELFATLEAYQAAQHRIGELGKSLSPILRLLWNHGEADWQQIAGVCATTEQIERALLQTTRDAARTTASKQALRAHLECGLQSFRTLHAAALERFLSLERTIDEQAEAIGRLLQTSALTEVGSDRIGTLKAIAARWSAHLDLLHDWTVYNRQRTEMLSAGLESVVRAVEEGQVAADRVDDCYRKSLYRAYAEHILSQEPRMNTFHGELFEEKIRRFRALSRRFEQLTREELYAKLTSALPALQKEAAQNSEVGILQRNIRNGGRGTSIRRLFDQIPDLLTRMCPCLLMSPISVAQYIDAGRAPFDLVIFDEASQMPTSEAVGAIARGRNVIVVGDPKQMPPTDFFSTNTYDEENADKEDLESILDDCLALSIPSKHLLWHYRSKHESLIAFSNVKYYDNRLLTFPSPDDLTTKVRFRHVDGTYDRGSTRQNRAEAEAVVREIRARLTNPVTAKRSIGVVTFNSNQQSLIEDLLNDLFRENPALETLALECEEPIFIKNLENVQGDERDVILFSVGYGPDKTRRIALNFGPLNRDGGWRRLNVAVSRARYEMMVFSTLRSDQIDLNRTSAEGVAGLKAFLEYAEKGREALTCQTSAEHRTDDALLRSIAAELEERGYRIRTNVGCSGYRIDIGVVDPECPDTYLMGILCDGYNHNAARTAHDRVVTQSGVLQALGWQLYHVWAMDWWENRSRTIEALIAAIEEGIRHKSESKRDEPDGARTEEPLAVGPNAPVGSKPCDKARVSDSSGPAEQEPDMQARPYRVAELECAPVTSDDFAQGLYDTQAMAKIRAVIKAEAPISRALLCKRVLNSFGIARMGTRLAAHMDYLLNRMGLTATGTESLFYWSKDLDPKSYDIYRPDSKREALDIAPEEVAVAVCRILKEQGALPEADLIRETARQFNYTRLGDNVTASMTRGIAFAEKSGRVAGDDGKVKLKDAAVIE
ncbi:DUF3320 domain-containing protein [uncultured Alistipes sp.]|uniref:DUF3320 domain-containing protein n=1 Tax=uncultured Alistipes sp. TaxID=538949 RepID=UPI002639EE4A|nr:DUF3320 domain-containing protein [uncultured Alistipes sp.]